LLTAEEALDGTEAAIDEIFNLQPESLLDRAQQYIVDNRDSLYQKVCVEWDYCTKRNDPELADNLTLVAWLIDLITTILLRSPLVVATVAVILVKKGLATFCGCAASRAREV